MNEYRTGKEVPCRNILPLLLIALLLSHCSSENPGSGGRSHPALDTLDVDLPEGIYELDNLTVFPIDQSPRMRFTLEEEARFGNTEEVLLGSIGLDHILVDSVGRIFMGDGGWGHRGIHVYAPDGTFIKTMGGEGKGPGEIMRVSSMGIIGNELHMYDGQLDRINVYDLNDLEVTRTQNLDPQKWENIDEIRTSYLMYMYFRSDGTYLAGFVDQVNPELSEERRLVRYYRMNQQGDIISDKILEQRASTFIRTGTTRFNLEHLRSPLLSHSSNGNMVDARTEHFLLKYYNPQGKYQRALFYPFARRRVDEQKVLSKYDHWESNHEGVQRYRERIRDADLPELWPALHTMIRDDQGRMWVATVDNYQDSFTWWVLEDSGELLARFTQPQNERVAAVKDGYAYVLVEEGGSEEIVKYRLSFAPTTEPPQETQ